MLGGLKCEPKAYYIAVEDDRPLEIAHSEMCLEESMDWNVLSHCKVA